MTDRAKKITELDAITQPAAADLLIIETNPSSNAVTKKITLQNLLNSGFITSNAYQTANSTSSGVVKVGDQLSINATGHLSANINVANTTSAGIIKVGDQLSINATGFLNTNLNVANTTVLGVVKVGNNATINATGFLNVNLSSYVTSADLNYALNDYVTTGILATNLANYVTTTNLSANLAGYVNTNSIANTTSAGIIKVGTSLSVNATGFLNNDLTVPATGVQRVTTSGSTSANLSAKVIFCDPYTAGANITIQLPNTGISDGREYIVKNIYDGGNIVTVEVPGLQIEGISGLGSNAVLANSGYTGYWVWDETSTVYRAVNIYTP